MKHSSANTSTLRSRLASQLGSPVPMRRGSLTERRVKCSRPGCPCAERPDARHGPYFSLTRSLGGKTQTRLIPSGQAQLVAKQIEAGRQFRDAVDLYWATCERLADQQLETDTAQVGGEKGGSVRRSRRRLRERSSGS